MLSSYLAAVMSICEYMVSNKGACRLIVMTVGGREGYAPTPYILWGQLPPHGSMHRLC